MRVVHMDSGLGNQMLDYAEYLAIRESNPDGEIYIETLIYDLPDDRPGMFSKWNGYELERVFGIKAPMLRDRVGEEAWERMVKCLDDSRFWEQQWNYTPYIVEALNDEGYPIRNMRKASSEIPVSEMNFRQRCRNALTMFFRTRIGYHIKRYMRKILQGQLVKKMNAEYDIFAKYPDDTFIGHSFAFKYKGFGIEKIDKQIREAFRFPPITDEKNQRVYEEIRSCNAVAVHARRSDLLFLNGYCYKYGFFKRAIKYIKKHVENPVFYFFTDEKSVGWCEENEKNFGLDFKKDEVRFVDWNAGENSFRDMQLMAECKHNVFTESTFGFWGAYLNRNPDKITCAPDCTILATHHF